MFSGGIGKCRASQGYRRIGVLLRAGHPDPRFQGDAKLNPVIRAADWIQRGLTDDRRQHVDRLIQCGGVAVDLVLGDKSSPKHPPRAVPPRPGSDPELNGMPEDTDSLGYHGCPARALVAVQQQYPEIVPGLGISRVRRDVPGLLDPCRQVTAIQMIGHSRGPHVCAWKEHLRWRLE